MNGRRVERGAWSGGREATGVKPGAWNGERGRWPLVAGNSGPQGRAEEARGAAQRSPWIFRALGERSPEEAG